MDRNDDDRKEITVPEVGMGCTMGIGSDSYAGTIIEVSRTGHRVVVQQDKATRTDNNGMSESQEYSYERNPNGKKDVFTRRRNGRYLGVGTTYFYLGLGYRRQYQDPSF